MSPEPSKAFFLDDLGRAYRSGDLITQADHEAAMAAEREVLIETAPHAICYVIRLRGVAT